MFLWFALMSKEVIFSLDVTPLAEKRARLELEKGKLCDLCDQAPTEWIKCGTCAFRVCDICLTTPASLTTFSSHENTCASDNSNKTKFKRGFFFGTTDGAERGGLVRVEVYRSENSAVAVPDRHQGIKRRSPNNLFYRFVSGALAKGTSVFWKETVGIGSTGPIYQVKHGILEANSKDGTVQIHADGANFS